MRHQSLTGQAAAITAETQDINRRLHDLLLAYLALHVPQCAGDAQWRWEVSAADQRGILFACNTFFHGFDMPGRPREVLIPMAWIWWQQPSSRTGRVEPSSSPAGVSAGPL